MSERIQDQLSYAMVEFFADHFDKEGLKQALAYALSGTTEDKEHLSKCIAEWCDLFNPGLNQ